MHKVREYAIAIKRNHLTKYLNLKVVYKSIWISVEKRPSNHAAFLYNLDQFSPSVSQ
jgi:hypothetical protein